MRGLARRGEVLERLQRGVAAHGAAYRAFHGCGVALQLRLIGYGFPRADDAPALISAPSIGCSLC
jgi:hypothetical protein